MTIICAIARKIFNKVNMTTREKKAEKFQLQNCDSSEVIKSLTVKILRSQFKLGKNSMPENLTANSQTPENSSLKKVVWKPQLKNLLAKSLTSKMLHKKIPDEKSGGQKNIQKKFYWWESVSWKHEKKKLRGSLAFKSLTE